MYIPLRLIKIINTKYYYSYTFKNYDYIIISDNPIEKLIIKNPPKIKDLSYTIISSFKNNKDITKLIKKYSGIFGDFHYSVFNKQFNFKDIYDFDEDEFLLDNEINITDGLLNDYTITIDNPFLNHINKIHYEVIEIRINNKFKFNFIYDLLIPFIGYYYNNYFLYYFKKIFSKNI